MAKLDQLEICGIRSFSPNQTQQLKFTSPLTVILGQNGCGKTTIIESILYACTGEIPSGTTNGQGFVNDPNMTLSHTVKGFVKLKFIDQLEKEITVHRVVELSRTKTAFKFSTKANTIRAVDATGKDVNLGGRCFDITKECCRLMNVSEGVLNYVIFCHQENSAWPLEERKKLKDRFDEIFDAEKYNKLVELYKKRLKNDQANIKMLVVELKYKAEKKDLVLSDKEKLAQKEVKLQQLINDITKKKEEGVPLLNRIKEICALEEDLGKLHSELAAKEQNKQSLVEQQTTILGNIGKDFEGTDQELEEKIQDFEKEQQKEKIKVATLEENLVELKKKERENDFEIQKKQEKRGQLTTQRDLYIKRCSQRDELIKKAKTALNISTNFNNFVEVSTELKKAYKVSEENFKKITECKEKNMRELQNEIDNSREGLASTKQSANMKKKIISEKEEMKRKIISDLQKLGTADDDYAKILNKLENFDKILSNLKTNFNEGEETEKILKYKREIENKEQMLNKFEREHRILQQNDTIEGKLESENKLISEKSADIETLKNKHFNDLKILFDKEIPEKRMKECVTIIQNRENSKLQSVSKLLMSKQNEEMRLKMEEQNQKQKIEVCKTELDAKQEKIQQVCNGKSYQACMDEAYRQKEILQRQKGQYSSTQVIFGEFLKEFEKDSPCCPVCETTFSQRSSAIKTIVTKIRTKLSKVPNQLLEVEENLRKEEERYNWLLQLQPLTEEIQLISEDKLPLLKDELQEIQEKLRITSEELVRLEQKQEQPKKIVEICQKIITDVAAIDQNQADIDKAKQNVRSLESQKILVDSMKSKFEIEAEIDGLKSSISELRRKIDSITNTISTHKDRLQQVTQQKCQVQNEQARMQELMQKRPILEEQKKELITQINILNEEYEDLQASISMFEIELQSAIKAKDSAETEKRKLLDEERNKLINNRQLIVDIEKIEKEIGEYVKNNIDIELKGVEDSLTYLKEKGVNMTTSINKIQSGIDARKEEWAKEEIIIRNLKDAKIYREKKRQEVVIQSEINRLKEKIGGYNFETIYQEKNKLIQNREILQKEINIILGEKGALEANIRELQTELDKPANKNALQDWMFKKYELKIRELALKDLTKFIAAFEESILLFHRSKMIQINKIIRDLWRTIYKGNDIDHIEIKTEAGTGKKGYDYKVVQKKGRVEMDLRGRCSAGQKVLACLIIRMALAESLSANCGILALDEPTTNLDKENIESLSETIGTIVTTRSLEKNFQLLLITHDEDFIRKLNMNHDIPHYYKVSRDHEGFSKIDKQYVL